MFTFGIFVHFECAPLVSTFQFASKPFLRSFTTAAVQQRKKILFLGTPDVAAQTLNDLFDAASSSSEFEICAVVSQPAAYMGRGTKRALTPSPVSLTAAKHGLKVFTPEKASDSNFLAVLEELKPDLCITAAYGQYLPKRFLAIAKYGTLNIHPSLLPRWRGASPVQRALEAGDKETGVTVLFTVSKMDAGPIAAQVKRELEGNEKSTELLQEMFSLGTRTLLDLLPNVWNESCSLQNCFVQDEACAVKADKITVEESAVCFSKHSAECVHNRVRGFADWPGVWTTFQIGDRDMQRIILVTTRVVSQDALPEHFTADASVIISGKNRIFVRCFDGSLLELIECQPPGKKKMDARSFINGLRGQNICWVENLK